MVVVFTCGKKTILQQTSNDSVLYVSLFVYLAIKEVSFHSPVFIKGIPKCLYIYHSFVTVITAIFWRSKRCNYVIPASTSVM